MVVQERLLFANGFILCFHSQFPIQIQFKEYESERYREAEKQINNREPDKKQTSKKDKKK